MQLHNLQKTSEFKKKKRVGRGNASTWGTFCGRGCKGMGQRKSGNVRPGFEGGQTPLLKRLPKLKGFKNPNKVDFQVLNLKDFESFSDDNVTIDSLHKAKMISKKSIPVKILSYGDLKKKLVFESGIKFSKLAKDKILKAGGTIG